MVEKEMFCCICGKALEPGQHVFPGLSGVWHKKCEAGSYKWVVGSDGMLRPASDNDIDEKGYYSHPFREEYWRDKSNE